MRAWLLCALLLAVCSGVWAAPAIYEENAYGDEMFSPASMDSNAAPLGGYSLPLADEEAAAQMEEPHAEALQAPAAAPSFLEADAEAECTGGDCPAGRPRHNLYRNRKRDNAPSYFGAPQHLVRRQKYARGQPVGRHSRGSFGCKGGGCSIAKQGRRNKPSGHKSNPRYKIDKLSVAFQAIKEDIMQNASDLRSEKKWSRAVKKLVGMYRQKMSKVSEHVTELKKETRNLLRKKRQIQNAQIQRKLTRKLRYAQADMLLLQKQLAHITNKESEFSATEKNLKETMRQLRLHLRKLRGTKEPATRLKPYTL